MKQWSLFEKEIELTNQNYERRGLGVITKIPNGNKTVKTAAGIRTMNTDKTGCDFIGHIKGMPIAFDAKNTKNKTNFPLEVFGKPMVKPHQEEFLSMFNENGKNNSIAFLLIRFEVLNKCFAVPIHLWLQWKNEMKRQNKKSISIELFNDSLIVEQRGYFWDYINNPWISENIKRLN